MAFIEHTQESPDCAEQHDATGDAAIRDSGNLR